MSYVEFNSLLGKTLKAVYQTDNDVITFATEDGEEYQLYYEPDCCASCVVEDVVGDYNDLVGSPIIRAEENSSNENPEGVPVSDYQESFTWTFYRIGTAKGTVVIRWYGSSNGYYSESVSFRKV
jgi:hypothetical protein